MSDVLSGKVVAQSGSLSGVLSVSSETQLSGKIAVEAGLTGSMRVPEFANRDIYEGEYTVTPKVTSQILETKYKAMKDNVSVKGIPYFQVDNVHKGQTIIIGDELTYGS